MNPLRDQRLVGEHIHRAELPSRWSLRRGQARVPHDLARGVIGDDVDDVAGERPRRRHDRTGVGVHGLHGGIRHILDHACVNLGEGGVEVRRFRGDAGVGVEDDHLGFGRAGTAPVRLDPIGHHACSLVGSGRAPVRLGRDRDDEYTVLGHGDELVPQALGLRTRLPRVHDLGLIGRGTGEIRDGQEVDPRSHHQPGVGQGDQCPRRRPVGDRVARWIHRGHGRPHDIHAVRGLQRRVGVPQTRHRALPVEDEIAHDVGRVVGVRFDQRDRNRLGTPQADVLGHGHTGHPTAHDHHGRRCGAGGFDKIARDGDSRGETSGAGSAPEDEVATTQIGHDQNPYFFGTEAK